MAYKKYKYGSYKKEVKTLLRKRLSSKERLRYHQKQVDSYNQKIKNIEQELDELLKII